jgi:hypothetical protein
MKKKNIFFLLVLILFFVLEFYVSLILVSVFFYSRTLNV